ncbi:MAG: DUF4838 domain-containing protein [Phycisphaeraceae bacterium]|nr:DUF4838 domain-containing protein [Phycisphaeraceae bacterium]
MKHEFRSLCAGIALGAAMMGFVAAARGESDVTLVKDGKPASTIVVAAQATRSARMAAAEVQWHIQKVTGATIPIVADDAAVEGPRILVGATRAMKLSSADFQPQEYQVRVSNDMVVLMGRDKDDRREFDYQNVATFPEVFDEQGSLYAAYDFLERCCDVRWYLPTDLGVTYTSRLTLTVKACDVRRAPAMKNRWQDVVYAIPADLRGDTIKSQNTGPALSRREQVIWLSRNRVGGEAYKANHSFYGYYDRFLKDHPDWFAQGYQGKPPQLCYAHPDLIAQVVQDARDYFDGKGVKPQAVAAGDYFALVPMDNGQWCKCDRCKALWLEKPKRGEGQFSNDSASDYVFGFINKVAREVHKTHPDKYLATLAYATYAYPPAREPLEPNVSIQLCLHTRNVYNPSLLENDHRMVEVWRAESRDRRLFLWTYYCFPALSAVWTQYRCFPGFVAHSLVKELNLYNRNGIRGLFFEPSYLGESKRSILLDQLETHLTWKMADEPTQDGQKLIDEFFSRYYGSAGEAMKQVYVTIETIYSDPANYPSPTHQTEELAWGKLGTEERMAGIGKLMEAARAAAVTDLEKQRVGLFDKGIWQYMQAGRAMYLERNSKKQSTMRSLRVPRISDAGGNPIQANWSQAVNMGTWLTNHGESTPRQVAARMAHDGRSLYVQLCEQLDTGKLVVNGNTVWGEDEWELFVARRRSQPYRVMGVNSNGIHIDVAFGESPDKKWDSGVTVVSDKAAPDGWTTSIAMPLAKLLPEGVRPGQTIYLNIYRLTRNTDMLAWVPSFGGLHDPSRFGEVVLDN